MSSDEVLPDNRMTASSSKSGYIPSYGRLNKYGAWSPEFLKEDEYLQVNFLEIFKVTFVATRGYTIAGQPCFVKSYVIMYRNSKRKWIMYRRENDRVSWLAGIVDLNIH